MRAKKERKIRMGIYKDLKGKRFGRLIVIEFDGRRDGYTYWKCRCDCGNIKIAKSGPLNYGYTKSCGCLMKDSAHESSYKGTRDIAGRYFSNVKNGAESRGFEFNITIEYLQQLLEKQNYRCALSGIEISGSQCTLKKYTTYKEMTASIDRIDSTKGYVLGNVQWVHKDINKIKINVEESYFIELCKAVTNYQKEKR